MSDQAICHTSKPSAVVCPSRSSIQTLPSKIGHHRAQRSVLPGVRVSSEIAYCLSNHTTAEEDFQDVMSPVNHIQL